MPKMAANLTMLWPELEPYDRFRAAAAAGFRHVEMLFPQELDVARVQRLLQELDLNMVLFDPSPGDWASGERGLLSLPGREEEFLATVEEAVGVATRLGTRRLNALVGIPPAETPNEVAELTALDNLRRVVDYVGNAGCVLLVEAVNNTDMPGYWAGTTERSARLVQSVDHPALRLQLDQYHAAMAGEDAIASFHRWHTLIAHVQIADSPGRHQPGTGGQPIGRFLAELDRLRYDGFVGLEYKPLGPTAESLAWMQELHAPDVPHA